MTREEAKKFLRQTATDCLESAFSLYMSGMVDRAKDLQAIARRRWADAEAMDREDVATELMQEASLGATALKNPHRPGHVELMLTVRTSRGTVGLYFDVSLATLHNDWKLRRDEYLVKRAASTAKAPGYCTKRIDDLIAYWEWMIIKKIDKELVAPDWVPTPTPKVSY